MGEVLVESRGAIALRPSLLNLDVRLSPHPASDSIRHCLCSCVNNRGNSHVEPPGFLVSSCGDFYLCGASELAPQMSFSVHIWHMNGFVVLRL